MWEEFKQSLSAYSTQDRKLIERAFRIAEESHAGQTRVSGRPYFIHPVAVAKTIIEMKLDAPTVAAALLHDVLEDTLVSQETLTSEVGKETTFLVEALTKLDRVQYQGFERKVESTRKMFLAVAEDVRVVLIKLADRLHNMQTISALPSEKQKRIAQETLELYAPLAYRLGMGELKGELEDLAFPIVHHEEYEWVIKETRELLPERQKYLKKIMPAIEQELRAGGVKNFIIDSRAKHYYSLWKKLLRHDLDLDRITDLAALRIIVHTIEECYQALGIIHALWKPIPGRIKDYISLPKPNGYRSLHTTVFCIDNRVTEFQIRTREMHQEAEFGIAAHWVWEEAGKPKVGLPANEEKIAWVKKLQEWQKEFQEESGEEFMEALKIDFFKDRIFVLTPKGEVIDLPEGSTPVDFAYHIHSEIGNHMAGAKVNGKMVPFSYALASGDSVEILVGKNKKPSVDWLDIAHSSLARNHIRSALRKSGVELRKTTHLKVKDKDVILEITRETRVGLLKDLAQVIAKEHINITKTESDVENISKPFLTMQFRVAKNYDLEKLLTRLRRVKGVREIRVTIKP